MYKKTVKYHWRYYKLKSILVFFVCGMKRDDITKLFVIAIYKNIVPSNEDSTTTAAVVQRSTTAPQKNLRSSNNFDIACDIICDIIRSSITKNDSTNKRKLTHRLKLLSCPDA